MALLRKCLNNKGPEDYIASSTTRQWGNWIVVFIYQVLSASGFSMLLPSMHQFITNPRESVVETTKDNQSLHILPGLGASEYVYSWIVTAYAIGEIAGASTAGLLTVLLPYHVTFPLSCIVQIIGGVIYSTSVNIFMMFTARFLMGAFAGLSSVLIGGYLGESCDYFDAKSLSEKKLKEQSQEKSNHINNHSQCTKENHVNHSKDKKKRTVKDFVFILFGFAKAFAVVIVAGTALVVSKIPRIHQFRWGGWFTATLGVGYIVLFFIVFEIPCWKCTTSNKALSMDKDKENPKSRTLRVQLSSQSCCSFNIFKQIVVYTFFIFSGYLGGAQYVVMDTLINPILQDQFGFTITDISIFILIGLCLPILAVMLILVIKTLSIDNRMVFAGLLLVTIAGGVIMSDWQAIGNDPCSIVHCNRVNNSLENLQNPTKCSGEVEVSNFKSFLNLSVSEIEDLCVNGSTPEHTCYWNPRSRITGKYCSECTKRCNSVQKSLNFIQLSIGMTLNLFVLQITVVFLIIIASDYTPTEYQGIITSAIYTFSGVARIISPIWSDWVYEASNKHTYLVMTINSSIMALVLLLLLILYKHIGPKLPMKTNGHISKRSNSKSNHENSKELLQSEGGQLIPSDPEEDSDQ